MTSFADFLKDVSDPPLAQDKVDIAFKMLTDHEVGVDTQEILAGLNEADLDTVNNFTEAPLVVRSLIRRALRVATSLEDVKRRKLDSSAAGSSQLALTGSSLPLQQSQDLASQRLGFSVPDVVGQEASALTLAKLLKGTTEVDQNKLLTSAGCQDLPFAFPCDTPVWRIMQAETDDAGASGRIAFSYIDLTAKEILPMWMPQDTIGGSNLVGSEFDSTFDGEASTRSLNALASALKAALVSPRFFRTWPQWQACFMRWAVAAISCNQMTLTRLVTYFDMLAKLHAENTALYAAQAPFLIILYDDLFRKQLAKRAHARDPDLSLDKSFRDVDKGILEGAKTRLQLVLQAAGVDSQKGSGSDRGLDRSSAAAVASANAESALAKQSAAAEAVERRANAAVRNLAKQQDSLQKVPHNSQPGNDQKQHGGQNKPQQPYQKKQYGGQGNGNQHNRGRRGAKGGQR